MRDPKTGKFVKKTEETKVTENTDVPEVTEAPVTETTEAKRRTKRHYQRLREGKSVPAAAILHTSKNGKTYYETVIGSDPTEYV